MIFHHHRFWEEAVGLGETDTSRDPSIVIVNAAGGFIGLLVKGICNVVEVDMTKKEGPPASMLGIQGEYFTGGLP